MPFPTAGRNSFSGRDSRNTENMFQTLTRYDEFMHHIWALGLQWATDNYFPLVNKVPRRWSRGKPFFKSSALFNTTDHFASFAGVLRPWKSKMQMKKKSGGVNTEGNECFLKSRQKVKIRSQGVSDLSIF